MSDQNSSPAAPAAAPAQPAHVSDTSGMSPTQKAAMARVDANRAAIAADPTGFGTLALRNQNKADLAHVFHGGPVPSGLQLPTNTAPTPQPVDTMQNPLAGAFTPITGDQVRELEHSAKVQGWSGPDAAQLAKFCAEAGLSRNIGETFARRALYHVREFGSAATDRTVNPEQHAELVAEARQVLGGTERAALVARQALSFIASLPAGSREYATSMMRGSLGLDPFLLQSLAAAWVAKGGK
jgi:hypothetical protein